MSILAINSSALSEASVSNVLVRETVASLNAQRPGVKVTTRDVGANPLPHLNGDLLAAFQGGGEGHVAQAAAYARSNELIAELQAADTIVIGAPMYNFGIPSTLKAWFDHVLRAGVTFSYSEAGPQGLLKGKRAIVVETRGGLFSEGPNVAMDSQEPHLRTMLGFIGISDVTFVRAEKLAFGPEAREQALAGARKQIGEIVADDLRLVA